MKQFEFPNLGESYFEEKLDNGLTIRVVPKPEFAKTHAFFAADYGSLDTKFQLDGQWHTSPAGVAHYLEHKMFDMPEGNVMQMFSKIGGSPNAFTSPVMTAYYVECTDCIYENVELLLHYVTTPYFTEESVEKERGIIAQEIQMYRDSAGARIYENLFSTMFPGHPMSESVAGTVESIGEITAQTLYDCHRAFYDPSNMVLVVVGPVDAEKIVALAKEIVPASNGKITDRDYGVVPDPAPEMLRVEERMEVSMPEFLLAFRCPVLESNREQMKLEMVGSLAAEMVVGESGPLYNRLYEEGLVDGSFVGGYDSGEDVGFFYFGTETKAPDAVVSAVMAEAERVGREGVDPALFARLKKAAFGRKIREFDSFGNICYRMSESYFQGVDYFEFPSIYQEITMEDAQKLLRDWVKVAGAGLSIIYPKEVS